MAEVARNSVILRQLVSIEIDGANFSTSAYKPVATFMIDVASIVAQVLTFI
jgi:hypothetical protein